MELPVCPLCPRLVQVAMVVQEDKEGRGDKVERERRVRHMVSTVLNLWILLSIRPTPLNQEKVGWVETMCEVNLLPPLSSASSNNLNELCIHH